MIIQKERAAIQGAAMKVPSELPRLAKMTTSRIFVTGLVQKPFTVEVASGRFSKSATVGFLMQACTKPATQPAAIIGFRLVRGAAKKEEIIVIGWARATAAPAAERMPFTSTQI